MNVSAPLKTPLFDRHISLGARMVPFAGYSMPVQYQSILSECTQTRSTAGLFDVSHMGQVRVRGTAALERLNYLVSNDLRRLSDGQAQYNLLCDERGRIIDDLVVYRISQDNFFLCVNAANRQTDFAWLRDHLRGVEVVDESDVTALIAVQGPASEVILKHAGAPDPIDALKYYWATQWQIFGKPCLLSRTGYTGEDGFEIYIQNEDAVTAWDNLIELGQKYQLAPAGLGARDTLRLEMGYPLYGHEISADIDPYNAGLSWIIKLGKPEYVAKKAFSQLSAMPRTRKLVALQVDDRRIPRHGYTLHRPDTEAVVGNITSGSYSPHVAAPIALAYIETSAQAETDFAFLARNDRVPCRKVSLPFVRSRTKRS